MEAKKQDVFTELCKHKKKSLHKPNNNEIWPGYKTLDNHGGLNKSEAKNKNLQVGLR